MLRFLPKFLLVGTAFAPVLLTFAAVSIWYGEITSGLLSLAAALTAVLFCLIVMRRASQKLSVNAVSIKSIKPADKEIVGFVLAYLLPLARGSQYEGFPLVVVLTVFFVVIMTSNAYHTNPLLGLLGYHFYEVTIDEVGYILISRQTLHNTKSIKRVVSFTDYMLLDVTGKKL